MIIHYQDKNDFRYPAAVCGFSGIGEKTNIYDAVTCTKCMKYYESGPRERSLKKADRNHETKYSTKMQGERG